MIKCRQCLKFEKYFAGTNKRPRCLACTRSKRSTSESLDFSCNVSQYATVTNCSFFVSLFRCGILQRTLLKQTLVGLVGESVPSGGRGKAPGKSWIETRDSGTIGTIFFCSSDSGPARGGAGRNVKGGDLPNRWNNQPTASLFDCLKACASQS